MSLWKWSQTAGLNNNADPTINWVEGQAPSTVNDSARGMMAAIAKYRDDTAGTILTTGTATAYVITSNQGFDTLAHLDKQLIAFVTHTTNGAGPVTLNVDGTGAKPIRLSPGQDLPAGVLIQGTPYGVTYNNTDGAFYIFGFTGASSLGAVPIGGLLPYAGIHGAPNSSYVLPIGQSLSRTVFSALFALVGTTYGGSGTTFKVPDLRGRAVFGQDNMGGTAAGNLAFALDGTIIGNAGGQDFIQLTTDQLPAYTPTGVVSTSGLSVSGTMSGSMSGAITAVAGLSGQISAAGANFGVPAGASSIPVNVSGSVTGTLVGSGGSATFLGNAQGGLSDAVMTFPPGIVVPYILRVL